MIDDQPKPGWLKREFTKVSQDIAEMPEWFREQAGLQAMKPIHPSFDYHGPGDTGPGMPCTCQWSSKLHGDTCPEHLCKGEPFMQPAPKPNNHPPLWDGIIEAMLQRDKQGFETYGVRLQPFNGRDFLQDALEEVLDFLPYLKGAMVEWDAIRAFIRRLLSPEAHGLWLTDTREGREIQDEARRLLNVEGK
jgi:hypothetical protein